MLALAVGGLILIDITILLTYTAVEGYRGNLIANKVPNRENMRDVDGVSVESIGVMLEVIYSAWEYLFLIRNWNASLTILCTSVTREPAMLSWECSTATRECCRSVLAGVMGQAGDAGFDRDYTLIHSQTS